MRYTLMEFAGYIHEWPVWRVSLKDLLPRLFQSASKLENGGLFVAAGCNATSH